MSTKSVKLPTSTITLLRQGDGESVAAAILRHVNYSNARKDALAKDHAKRAEAKAAEMAAFAEHMKPGAVVIIKGGKNKGTVVRVAAFAVGKVIAESGATYSLRSLRLPTDEELAS